MLSEGTGPFPGRWRTDRIPFTKGIHDAVNEEGVSRIIVMKSSQVSGTEFCLNVLGYFIQHDPSPVLFIQPTLDLAEAFSKDRLDPMIRDTPVLAERVANRASRDTSNTLLYKRFKGGYVTLAGANSPASLASRPIRVVLCDETDRYPRSAGDEGNPLKLAQKRTTTFWNALFIEVSTPVHDGASAIQDSWNESDQRRYFVPCPECNAFQVLKWDNLKWDKDANGKPITVWYECESCSAKIPETKKYEMVSRGEWRATRPFYGIAGFHINEIYSTISARGWMGMVREFLEALGNPEKLKTFFNTALGEPFKAKEGEQPDWEKIYGRRESYSYGSVNEEVQIITAGCDVQKDRLEVEVVGWLADKSSYSLDYLTFFGDTSEPTSSCWLELEKLLNQTFSKPSGTSFPIGMLAVDSGYNTQTVYNWARKFPPSRVMVTKGQKSLSSIVNAPKMMDVRVDGKKIKRGIRLWSIGVDVLKSELYGWLKLPRPEAEGEDYRPGYCHFPQYPEEYFKQITAEVLTSTVIKGRKVYDWTPTRPRNEALDCRIMARAAAHVLGLDRLDSERLGRLSSRVASSVKADTPSPSPGESAPDKSESQRPKIRRVKRDSWI